MGKSVNHPKANKQKVRVFLNEKKIIGFLVIILVIIIIANILGQMKNFRVGIIEGLNWVNLFSMSRELNIPSLFSVWILFTNALLFAFITLQEYESNGRYKTAWGVLCLGFFFLAFDEGASIHELLVDPTRRLIGESNPSSFFFTWTIPALIGSVFVALIYARFLWSLPKSTRWQFILAAALYLGGAIGFELVEGRILHQTGIKTLAYCVMEIIEETMEIAGAILLLHALFFYIRNRYPTILFSLGNRKE